MWRSAVWAAAASSVALVALTALALSRGILEPQGLAWVLLSGPPIVVPAAYLLWRRPSSPIGPLMMFAGLGATVIPNCLEIITVLRFVDAGIEGWMWLPMWAAQVVGLAGAALIGLVVGLLPDGRIRYPHERWLVALVGVVALLPTVGLLTSPTLAVPTYQFPGIRDIASPFYVDALGALGPAVTTASLLAYLVTGAGVASLFVRYRRTTAAEQRQLRWVLLAGVVTILFTIVPYAVGQLTGAPELLEGPLSVLVAVPGLAVPLSIVASVMEPRGIDVDRVLRRSVVYGTLSLLILAVYVAVAAGIGLTAGAELPIEAAIVVTVVVALVLQPVRSRLQRWADHWVFGERPTPYEALAGFTATVDTAADPADVLRQLAQSARHAARLRWVTATVPGVGSRTAGRRVGAPSFEVEIRHRDASIGRLAAGPPVDGSLDPNDVALVRTMAGHAGLALANARLASRIVRAQEEERRRIERNLHDGAQQELIALIARLSMARSDHEAGSLDPGAFDDLAIAARRILTDVRELAQGIHPSIVADGGILAAVQERCASLPIDVDLDVEPGLSRTRFPAPVEGAAYFLVAESLANVLQHAGATRVRVGLRRRGDRLSISVEDDGLGFDPAAAARRGLAGLEDRFTALGGSVRVASRPGGGTRVLASLPVSP